MRILKKYYLSVPFFFVLVIFSFRPIADNDIGFHLHAGQWIIENLTFPTNDTFTYTVRDHLYIDLHWLYQLALYGVYVIGGFKGISVTYTISLIILFALLYYWMHVCRLSFQITSWVLLIVLLIIDARLNFRPEIITWILIILTCICIDLYLVKKKNVLWLLPIIMIVWINAHGLFVIGLWVVVAYTVSDALHSGRIDRRLLCWLILSAIAVFINPYFLDGVLFPVELATRLESGNVFKNSIFEFASPWTSYVWTKPSVFPTHTLFLYYTFTFIVFLLMIISIRSRKIHELLICVSLFYVSYEQYRNIPLFVLYTSGIMIEMVSEISGRLSLTGWVIRLRPVFKFSYYVFIGIVFLLSLRIITNAFYVSDKRWTRFGWGIDDHFFSTQAAEFLIDHKLEGKLLNNLGVGSWFGWKLKQPVFIDARLEVMKERFYKEFQASFIKGGLERLIIRYQPEIIVFDYAVSSSWQIQLNTMTDWRLVYWDYNSAIYLRKGFADHIATMKIESAVMNMGFDNASTDMNDVIRLIGPAEPPWRVWISGFFRQHEFPVELLHMALFAESAGEFKSAERLYFEFVKKSRGQIWEAFYNLGMVYFRTGSWKNALICLERYQEFKPSDGRVRQLILEARNRSLGG